MKTAITSTVRTSRTDLRMFVNYYLNSGIDQIFLFFDDPSDESIEYFRNLSRVNCVPCQNALEIPTRRSIEQRQVANAVSGLEMARRRRIDWLIHVDSDELILTPERNIKRYLIRRTNDNVDAVTFPSLEAVPKLNYTRHFFEDIHWFKVGRSTIPRAETIARLLGCRNVFEYGYFRGHRTGKTATKIHSPVKSLGIHLPTSHEGCDLRIITSSDAFTLHFDCCTFDDWKLKWQRRYDRTAVALEMRPDRQRQFDDFLTALHTGLEPIREVWIHDEGFAASRLSMMRIMARRTNAATVVA